MKQHKPLTNFIPVFFHKYCAFSICIGLLILSLAFPLTGCGKETTPISVTSIKLDTVVSITIYDSDDTSLLEECLDLCDQYELIFSRTNKDSELYHLNAIASDGISTVTVSDELYTLIEDGIYYSSLSNQKFSIALEPLTSLWDFTTDSPVIPPQNTIDTILPLLCSNDIILHGNNQISYGISGMGIDLGAIAKGYIADKIKEYLLSQDVTSAMISLGGNILCIGNKVDEIPFTIGIQQPFGDRNETIGTIKASDKSIVSSGIYERYFEMDDMLYHHLLNPDTGYPFDNDLVSVTIISDRSVDGDALSTVCFSLGLKDGLALVNSLDTIEAIFITKNDEIYDTNNLMNN